MSKFSRFKVLMWCLGLGFLGAHRFYVKRSKSAVVQLITLGGLGLWMLIDVIWIACGVFKDADHCEIRRW